MAGVSGLSLSLALSLFLALPLFYYSGYTDESVHPIKSEWPELVGVQGKIAGATIKRERPGINVIIVRLGDVGDHVYLTNRVRVWVNDAGVVALVPKIG